MSGLLNAARQKLWDIVNEVAKAKPTPRLRVGLVTYGNSAGSEDTGYVRVLSDLTGDLDGLYAKLIGLRTGGATEYVARVIHRSLTELSWSKDPDALRQIYVAGNESADQDRTVSLGTALRLAKAKDVFVNAIYCGSASAYDAKTWQSVALDGRGMFASIDHNSGTVVVNTPYDAELNRLSARLNGTYIGYGRRGRARMANQAAQDRNALRVHAAAGASRALAKASGVYRNASWDLVDARQAGKLASIKRAALPAKLRNKSKAELTTLIEAKAKERRALKKRIVKLSKKRRAHVAAQLKKTGKTKTKSFEYAVKRALRRQAKAKKMRF